MANGNGNGALVYPNPGSGKRWADTHGRAWERRGTACPDEKRTRALLRRDGVLMATWWAGQVAYYDSAEEKRAAADKLLDAAERPGDVVASEWKSADGTVLLLLEHHC